MDLVPVLAAVVTEYRLLSKTCACCGVVSTADWTAADDVNAEVVASAGSPVRIGPRVLAMCALLTCGHYLPVGRATALLETLTGLQLACPWRARPTPRLHRGLRCQVPSRITAGLLQVPARPAMNAVINAVDRLG